MRLQALALPVTSLLLLTIFLSAGCLSNGDDGEGTPTLTVEAPEWSIGQWWRYAYTAPEGDDLGFKLVVGDKDETDYWVGTEKKKSAQYHAVLNFNPVLGRVRVSDFAMYEKGEPQNLLAFPLTMGKQWEFSYMVDHFTARVTKIEKTSLPLFGPTTLAYIEAEGSNATKLFYIYDAQAGWLYHFNLSSPTGESLVVLDMTSFGQGHSGEVYFVRARDLYDAAYTGPDMNVDDTFEGSEHPSGVGYDEYIYYLEFITGSGSSGSISLRDHSGDEAFRREFGSNEAEHLLGTIPVESGEWTVSVSLSGTSWLRMRIAGGIYYSWSL